MLLRKRLTHEEKEQEAKRIKLDQAAKIAEEIKEEKRKAQRPFVDFKGKITYHTDMIDIAMICDSLLDKVNKKSDVSFIGFDLEWPFSFKTGSGKVAVIQISPDLEVCYILHVSLLKKLPKSLNELLAHKNVRIVGNNIKNDIRKLARDFTVNDVEKMIGNCIDLGVMANTILPTTQRWSLEKLVDNLLDHRLDKNKKVRNSRWQIIPLSKTQLKYAAIDAYVSLLLYHKLLKKKVEMECQEESKEDDQNIINH